MPLPACCNASSSAWQGEGRPPTQRTCRSPSSSPVADDFLILPLSASSSLSSTNDARPLDTACCPWRASRTARRPCSGPLVRPPLPRPCLAATPSSLELRLILSLYLLLFLHESSFCIFDRPRTGRSDARFCCHPLLAAETSARTAFRPRSTTHLSPTSTYLQIDQQHHFALRHVVIRERKRHHRNRTSSLLTGARSGDRRAAFGSSS